MALRTVGSPITAKGLVFATSGDGKGYRDTIAVKLGGKGDVTADHLAWQNRKEYPFPYVPGLLARGDHLFSVHDKGTASCHAALTGEELWKEDLKHNFWASPILVDGKVYAVAEDGTVYVFAADQAGFKLLARNDVGESVSSTPAVADNRLYIRGTSHLFCIGKPGLKSAAK